MANIASLLLEFPPDVRLEPDEFNKRINAHINSFVNISSHKLAAAEAEQDLLELLDPSINSISYLFILKTRLDANTSAKSQTKDTENLRNAITFLNSFDGMQIRYGGSEFRKVVDFVDRNAARAPPQIVTAIRNAILRLDPTGGTLTSTHLVFVELCLANRLLNVALDVLDKVIYSYPAPRNSNIDGPFASSVYSDSSNYITESTGLTGKLSAIDVHEYYLSGAVIYIGLRRWERALLYLELVLTSPTNGVPNGLILEAHQKWMLVQCIVNSRAPDLPKTVSAAVAKILGACSKAYTTLADVFCSKDDRRLRAEITAGYQIWADDGNLGLVQELSKQLQRFYILSLQKTYSAIPLSHAAQHLNQPPDLTHEIISSLISEGALNASIDLRDGPNQEAVLRFYSNSAGPLAKTEEEYTAKLVRQTERTNAMMGHVKVADRRLMLTNEYIDAVRKKNKNKDDDGMLGAEGMDTGAEWSAYQDEDIMLDV